MQGTWWKDPKDLDTVQKRFMALSLDGKYVLTGPPGSGKTNLLLLRARHTSRKNYHNLLFLTYGTCLTDFVKSGVGPYFDKSLVMTYWSWARQHIQSYYPAGMEEFGSLFEIQNDEPLKRARLVSLLKKAYEAAPTHALYDAIFIDEAQDLSQPEIEEVAKLTSRITIAGDNRQGVYQQDGMGIDGFEPFEILAHYRIGRKICAVADKLLPPKEGDPYLLDNCQYREDLAESDATATDYESVEAQYDALIERLRRQRRVYRDELLGVFFPKKKMLAHFREYISELDLINEVAFHDLNDSSNSYASSKPIHAMTIHSAKGSEFRAAHIVRGEALKYPLHHREIIFTAVTRAKTSVALYFTKDLIAPIRSAFAEPTEANLEDLFDEA